MVSRLWRFLTTDISDLFSGSTVEGTAEAAEAVFELAEVLEQEGPNVQKLAPLVTRLDSLLDVLNSPLAEIVEKGLPFVSIATGLLKFYLEKSKRSLTLANYVALVSQAAYLESFKFFLKDKDLWQQIGRAPVSEHITKQIQNLSALELEEDEASRAVTNFPSSKLALSFGKVLRARLVQTGLDEEAAQILAERVTWRTTRCMNKVWAASSEAVKHLGQTTFDDWRKEQAKYQSIDDYLRAVIQPGPHEKVFNEEKLTFQDIYVPLEIQCLDSQGKPLKDEPFVSLEDWVKGNLTNNHTPTQILFIQGEAGRGKSVFCRMFADWVRQFLYPAYIPILIRLRHVKRLEASLTETLKNYLETYDFVVSDTGWLTDKNTRFLLLLDGFDELLLEGRESGGLKEFLQQIEQFQRTSHHRLIITGRPLALQGIERLISQAENLNRVEIQPMSDGWRNVWHQKWAIHFGQSESNAFQQFLSVCPKDVNNVLAREPLLLYLLGRMHREQRLTTEMFSGIQGIKAKIVIYDEAIRWVIEEQRQDQNFRLAGLDGDDLRRTITEAAVCVMQSGNEIAKVSFLEARLAQDENSPIHELLQTARKDVKVSEQKLLNNLLTTFYIKPASGDREGSVEFAHKSFGEFLFAEQLKDVLEDWSKKGGRRFDKHLVSRETMHWEVYDLLGYGVLTYEILEYLMALLSINSDFEPVQLFERLHDFYLCWWEGTFINAPPENLPQRKMRLLRERVPSRKESLGLQQVNTYAGLNVIILLFELHRYGQAHEHLKDILIFHPCGKPDTAAYVPTRLSRIMGMSECLQVAAFNKVVGAYLSRTSLIGADLSRASLIDAFLIGTDLSGADLSGADLSRASLIGADLSGAYLIRAYLGGASLIDADLSRASLIGANLSGAYLSRADLSGADLSGAYLSHAYLSGADLSRTSLIGAYFSHADLSETDLSRADLSRADLHGAALHGADFHGADLHGVYLNDADLSGVRNLTEAQLSEARLCRTRLPEYVDLDANRDCPE